MKTNLKVLDLFAGAGGLSEGFIRAGFEPVAYVEADKAACFTLKTRVAYHWLVNNGFKSVYYDYLDGQITRDELYGCVLKPLIDSVINEQIGKDTLAEIFSKIETHLQGAPLDLIIGGPPCQAFSPVGRARKNNRNDARNYLYIYYAEFLKKFQPKYFVFENVTGLLSAKDESGNRYLQSMIAEFKKAGYTTEYATLCSNDYGVLQHRKRVILIGKLNGEEGFYPEFKKWNPKDVTVAEIFKDLPTIKAGGGTISPVPLKAYEGTYLHDVGIRNGYKTVTWHQARPHTEQDLEIYRIAVNQWNEKQIRLNYNDLPEHLKTHHNREAFVDRFKVVAPEMAYSHTVVAHISKDGHYYIHPDISQNRSLTPREVARLQSFPDDYYFESAREKPGKTSAFRQIGNAVPVLLAQKIAEKLLEIW